jgi:hypothetical protein
MRKEIYNSLREYTPAVSKQWWGYIAMWSAIIATIAGVVGFIVWAKSATPPIPIWTIATVSGGVLLFIVVNVLTFQKVRKQRDEAISEVSKLRQDYEELKQSVGIEKQMNVMQNARPSIKYNPMKKDLEYYLEIKNIGAAAEFSAQIELIGGHGYRLPIAQNIVYPYSGFWELAHDKKANIKCNQKDRLKIVALNIKKEKRLSKRQLHFYYYNENGSLGSYETPWLTEGSRYKCKIRVTISSQPDLREQSYVLEADLDIWDWRWHEAWIQVKS